jgi:hypothetical protein
MEKSRLVLNMVKLLGAGQISGVHRRFLSCGTLRISVQTHGLIVRARVHVRARERLSPSRPKAARLLTICSLIEDQEGL